MGPVVQSWCDSYGASTLWLDLRPAPQEGIHAWYCPSQKCMAMETVGLRVWNYYCFAKWTIVKMPWQYYAYTYRFLLLSSVVRATSFCIGQWLMQRLLTGQSAQSKWLLSSQPQMRLLNPTCFKVRELWTELKKELRARGWRGASCIVFWTWYGYSTELKAEATCTRWNS